MVEASNRTWKSGNKRLSLKGSFCNVFKLDPEETNAFLASTRHFTKKRVLDSDSPDAEILFYLTCFFLFSFLGEFAVQPSHSNQTWRARRDDGKQNDLQMPDAKQDQKKEQNKKNFKLACNLANVFS